MRLAILTSLVMVAFAANSVLNRVAVDRYGIDPSAFALIRVLAGAVVLGMVMSVRGGRLPLFARVRIGGALSLSTYMIGFSLAYLTLDAGLGALILFGTVQVTMFVWSALGGQRPSSRGLVGAAVAFAGLMVVLWPGRAHAADPVGAVLMIAAGVGWAAYTMTGRGAADPLAATTANFILALPVMGILLIGTTGEAAPAGIALAIVSGGLTSGLGYALWYSVLPRLAAQTAAVVQLTVPLIALMGGVVLLGEPAPTAVLLSATMVIGGVALSVTGVRRS